MVLAIPRGAAPMARIIADALEGEMDIVLVHKLRMPGQPELAIGSVDETGQVYLGEYARGFGVSDDDLAHEKRAQLDALRARRARYSPVHSPIDPSGRIVIVVDDGIATGSTMIAALRAIRAKKPGKLIVATGVAPRDVLETIRDLADEVVCLESPEVFYAVGEFFDEFPQVSDEEVIEILKPGRAKSHTP